MLAAFDLTVGVANDAVNFLNAGIGSKAAPFRVILIIASAGVFTGVLFSSGMMEIARKGIFNPANFTMPELMVIFIAVMFTDILLLDLYNTFGLPTSTTITIIFGLVGSALAVTIITIIKSDESFAIIPQYINTPTVLKIIFAIFVSVFIAFIFGTIVQFVSRLIFTFDYKKRIKRYGALWGAVALSFITFFILIKGIKGATFLTKDTIFWIQSNQLLIIFFNFIIWTFILQLLLLFTKINILKIIVLFGTFALAMAFSANDLVNFIGAPMAGLNAYELASTTDSPLTTSMAPLNSPIKINVLYLIISGLIMIATLFLSKKARSVTKTELSLGRQEEGVERFESLLVSRGIVRMFISFFEIISKITPPKNRNFVVSRFDKSFFQKEVIDQENEASFDLIRAAVNLMVASALISLGTSLQLPLSTTYVTFIVAMSTALSDRSWGRESAVYRVSGVLTVVSGWLITAMLALTVAGIIATIIYFGDLIAVILLLVLAVFLLYRSARLHKKREKKFEVEEELAKVDFTSRSLAVDYLFGKLEHFLDEVAENVSLNINGLTKYNLKLLKKAKKQAKRLNDEQNFIVRETIKIYKLSDEIESSKGAMIVKSFGALDEVTFHLRSLSEVIFKYVDNNHNKLTEVQFNELNQLLNSFNSSIAETRNLIVNKSFNKIEGVFKSVTSLKEVINKINGNQMSRIKKGTINTRRTLLFFAVIDDTQAIAVNTRRLAKTCKEFYEEMKVNKL